MLSGSGMFGNKNEKDRNSPSPERLILSKPNYYSFAHLNNEGKQNLEKEILDAAKKVQKRTFKLTGFKNPEKPRLLFIGCQGDGGAAQAAVAKSMNELSKDELPDLIICAGDIVYKHGVYSPIDKNFYERFHLQYSLPNIEHIRWVAAPGNHDAGKHSEAALSNNYKGKAAIERMVGHSYIPDPDRYASPNDVVRLVQADQIPISALNPFNMLRDYAEYDLGPMTILCLDSNFIVEDFLNYVNKVEGENQFQWFLDRIINAKQAGKEIIIVQHHAPKSPGKRSGPDGHFDSHHYLTASQIEELCKKLGIKTKSYNEMIYAIYKKYQIISPAKSEKEKPVKVIAAHDHFLSIDDSPECFQLITGGGGGALQSCMSLRNHPDMKVHLRRFGYAVYQDGILDIHTISKDNVIEQNKTQEFKFKRMLRYDINNHAFILTPIKASKSAENEESLDPAKMNKLRSTILQLCDESLDKFKKVELNKPLEEKQKYEKALEEKNKGGMGSSLWHLTASVYSATSNYVSHLSKRFIYDPDAEERFCVNDTKAFFLQYTLSDFVSCLEYLREIHTKLKEIESYRKSGCENKFSQDLHKVFFAVFNETLEDFYQKVSAPVVTGTPPNFRM